MVADSSAVGRAETSSLVLLVVCRLAAICSRACCLRRRCFMSFANRCFLFRSFLFVGFVGSCLYSVCNTSCATRQGSNFLPLTNANGNSGTFPRAFILSACRALVCFPLPVNFSPEIGRASCRVKGGQFF